MSFEQTTLGSLPAFAGTKGRGNDEMVGETAMNFHNDKFKAVDGAHQRTMFGAGSPSIMTLRHAGKPLAKARSSAGSRASGVVMCSP